MFDNISMVASVEAVAITQQGILSKWPFRPWSLQLIFGLLYTQNSLGCLSQAVRKQQVIIGMFALSCYHNNSLAIENR